MALTARSIRRGLIGLVLIGALVVPVGTAAVLESLPTRAVMVVALLVSFGAFQLVSFQWSVLPALAILLLGSSVTQLFAGDVPPVLWWFTGLMIWALSTPELLAFSTSRLKPLAQHYASLDDVPRARLVGFHVPNWIVAAIVIACYTILLPILGHGQPPHETLTVALFGGITGCALALLTGKWRLYAVFLVSAVLAIIFLDRSDYATFLGMSWLAGYLLASVLKDPTTLHRSLAEVRKTTNVALDTEHNSHG